MPAAQGLYMYSSWRETTAYISLNLSKPLSKLGSQVQKSFWLPTACNPVTPPPTRSQVTITLELLPNICVAEDIFEGTY